MPNLQFYAAGDDRRAVLGAIFALELFRVFEEYSEPDRELREFHAPAEVPDGALRQFLVLHAVAAGPEPVARRIELRPGALGDATFRHCLEGWGLIQLELGGPIGEHELAWSRASHHTEKRALTWADSRPTLGDPARWDWATVTRASGRLNRAIRMLAVRKSGSHPVLPGAAQLIDQAGLRYERGLGLHATPSSGLTSR